MADDKSGIRRRIEFTVVLLLIHFTFIILYGVFIRYEPGEVIEEFNETADSNSEEFKKRQLLSTHFNNIDVIYPMFQDVNVMVFIGFGFLMTFLCRYALFDVSVNFLLSAFVCEWAILMSGFFFQLAYKGNYGTCGDILPNVDDRCIVINIELCLEALYTAAGVMISMGAVVGIASPLQLVLMAIPEVTLLQLNSLIITGWVGTIDTGKSYTTYTFGAFFGLFFARVVSAKMLKRTDDKTLEKPMPQSYTSEVFSMIGTIFLWMYWPSFNGGSVTGIERHRAVINTFLSIVSSCITTYALSAAVDKKGRFTMTHLQNATLAGGVGIGAACAMVCHPFGALIIGMVAGIISVLGFKYLAPILNSRGFTDACGVNNLHGMPGLYAAVVAAIVAGSGSVERYGSYRRLYTVFPFMAPENGTIWDDHYNPSQPQNISLAAIGIEPGYSYTFSKQAGVQIGGMLITVGIAIIGGVVAGVIASAKIWDSPDPDQLYDDSEFFVPTYTEGGDEDESSSKRKRNIIERAKDGVDEATRD